MTGLGYLHETPSQTAGPFVHIGLIPHQVGIDAFAHSFSHDLTTPDTHGTRIRLQGRVLDGLGEPCREVLLEIWQADAAGRYNSAGFGGWGRAGTDFETGVYSFETIKPGPVPGRHGASAMAPHINLWLVSRGINIGLSTRVYFADEAVLNEQDAVLRLIDPSIRRATLLAHPERRGDATTYTFDVRLQGDQETVFFDI